MSTAVSVWHGSGRLGALRQVEAGMARLGLGGPSGHGTSGLGQAGVARPGPFGRGLELLVTSRLVPAGSASQVPSRPVVSRQCGLGLGSTWQARPGSARLGVSVPVQARLGSAGGVRQGVSSYGLARRVVAGAS